jgi:predicted peroxiredoxin
MGVMGVDPSDLIEECNIAGASAFLDFAASADVRLFV